MPHEATTRPTQSWSRSSPRLFVFILLLSTLTFATGCQPWTVVDHRSSLEVGDQVRLGERVRLTTAEEVEVLEVSRVVYPWIDGYRTWGTKEERSEERHVNLRSVDRLEVRSDASKAAEDFEKAVVVVDVLSMVLALFLFFTGW